MKANEGERGFIDGRCHCERCKARTENTYRMIGRCYNCGLDPILILYRSGDKAAKQNCPACGNHDKVEPYRRATDDEIPALFERGGVS